MRGKRSVDARPRRPARPRARAPARARVGRRRRQLQRARDAAPGPRPRVAQRASRPDIICVRMTGYGLTGPDRDHVSYGPTLQALTGYTLAHGRARAGRPRASATRTRTSPAATWVRSPCWRRCGIAGAPGAASSSTWRSSRRSRACSGPSCSRAASTAGRRRPSATRRRKRPARRTACTRAPATIAGSRSPCSATTTGGASSRPSARRLDGRSALRDRRRTRRQRRRARRARRRVDARASTPTTRWSRLQEAGVAAGRVANAEDVCARDPQLAARGHFVDVATPEGRTVRIDGPPARSPKRPAPCAGPGPLLGEHTDEVLTILGSTATRSPRCAGPPSSRDDLLASRRPAPLTRPA